MFQAIRVLGAGRRTLMQHGNVASAWPRGIHVTPRPETRGRLHTSLTAAAIPPYVRLRNV